MRQGVGGVDPARRALARYTDDPAARLAPLGGGLINQTFRFTCAQGRGVLQRLNPIFPPSINADIDRVTAHLQDRGMATPVVLRTLADDLWIDLGDDGAWRALSWVEGTTLPRASSPDTVAEAASLLGRFHRALADLDIEFGFARVVHDTDAHLAKLTGLRADEADPAVRAQVDGLASSILVAGAALPALPDTPPRVLHGDPKLDNVRFDGDSQRALCLVDLDTLRRGPLTHDLGDAWRSWCNRSGEDEVDAARDLAVRGAAAAGSEGGRILVGEAGVGKSRLLDEIEALAEQRGLEVMRASGGRMGGGEHLGLIRELVFSLCGGPPGKGTDVAQQLSSLSRRGLGRHQLGRLDHLLGIAAESNQFKGEENQQLDRAVFGQLFMESPDRKGVCLLLDDLHQADAGSLQILDSLLDVASGRSFAIFGSVRAGEGVLPRVRQLEVAPLDDEAMRALVDERLGGERKTAAVADRIVAHAEGNPLFAHETIRVLMDRGALRLTRGAWKLTADDGKLPVPNNLRLLVSARFDALSPDARTLLRHAAVAGRTFSLDLVTAAAADTVADARAAVDECQAAGMLLPWEKMPGGYRFTQAVAHEIVLAGLTGTMERHIHLCIAGALETGLTVVGKNPAEALAYHLLEAGETAKGLHYLTVAADLLASRYAFAEAAKHHTRALELSFQLAEEAGPVLAADAAEPILNLAARAGDSTAMVSPERAATLLGDVLEKVPAGVAEVERARVLRTRGNALVKLGRIREAEAGFSVALKCVAGHDEPELDAGLRADMASAHEANGDYMLASSRLLEGLQRLWGKPSGDPDLMWTFLNQLGRIHLKSGEHEKAREFFENARQQAQQSSRPVGEARILTNLASVYGMKGDTARAEALYGEALALSERTGDSIGIARIQYNQGRLIAGLGRRDDAIDCLQQSLAIANQVGWREGIAAATQMLDSLKPKGTGPR